MQEDLKELMRLTVPDVTPEVREVALRIAEKAVRRWVTPIDLPGLPDAVIDPLVEQIAVQVAGELLTALDKLRDQLVAA